MADLDTSRIWIPVADAAFRPYLSVFSSDYNSSGAHGAALRQKRKPRGERAGRFTASRSRPSSSHAATTHEYLRQHHQPNQEDHGPTLPPRSPPASTTPTHRSTVAPCPRVPEGPHHQHPNPTTVYVREIQPDPNNTVQRGQCPLRSVCVRGTTARKSGGTTNASRCKQQIADRCSSNCRQMRGNNCRLMQIKAKTLSYGTGCRRVDHLRGCKQQHYYCNTSEGAIAHVK